MWDEEFERLQMNFRSEKSSLTSCRARRSNIVDLSFSFVDKVSTSTASAVFPKGEANFVIVVREEGRLLLLFGRQYEGIVYSSSSWMFVAEVLVLTKGCRVGGVGAPVCLLLHGWTRTAGVGLTINPKYEETIN